MGSKLIFNGISSEEFGIVIQAPPTYIIPEKDYTITHIQGRSGDFVQNNNSYQNVELTYSLACVFKKGTNFISNSQAISSWLHSADGYTRLEDSYDPEVYRLALYKDSTELQNFYDTVTIVNAVFNCKPQRFYKSGEKEVQITDGLTLYNPTRFKANPFICFTQVDNNSDSTITITNDVESYTITINPTNSDNVINIDCDVMECHSSDKLLNDKILIDTETFPGLNKGKSTITFSNVANLKIKPRWWSL